jgi:uncharacterized membrane protein
MLHAALVAGFGITITSHVSIATARTVVGVFLLLFGLKWLHKAILRSSGIKSLHDEAKIFEETEEMLEAATVAPSGLDRVGVTTALGGVFLEGLEVVFIVVALGGLQDVPSAVIGAVASLLIVAGVLLIVGVLIAVWAGLSSASKARHTPAVRIAPAESLPPPASENSSTPDALDRALSGSTVDRS